MNPPDDRDQLQAYLDGELPPEQVIALETRLRTEPPLADALLELTREEAILTEWARSAAHQAATVPLDSPRRPRLRRLVAAAIAAAAAVAGIAFLLGYFSKSPEGPPAAALARVEEVQGEVFIVPEHGEATPAQPGQPLGPGHGLRTQGVGSFAVVTFADSSRLELGGDTLIRLGTDGLAVKKVYLDRGTVAADITLPPNDPPMVVATPHAEARFQQTKSSFASAPDGTRIEQVKGNLQVTRKSDGRSIEVPTGWYAVASEKDAFKAQQLPEQVTLPRLTIKELPKEPTGPALSVSYSPDGALLAVGYNDGTIKIYDGISGELKKTLLGHKRPVKALAFAPVGCLLASGTDEKLIKLWDPIRGVELAALKGCKGSIESLAFSPDGALLATAGGHGKNTPEIRLWDVVGRQEVGVFPGEHTNYATAVAFSPDGKWLATGGRDNAVKVWDVYTRLVRHTLTGHTARINSVAFSADGKRLASGSRDRTVKLWDFAAGKEERTLPSHSSEVRAVAFTPDGKRLATADTSVTLWDPATGREQIILKGHKNAVAGLAFAPGARELATAGYDRSVRVWEIMKN
jgi:ferric-dicitrate binding protein FerR (iron transport regulator)